MVTFILEQQTAQFKGTKKVDQFVVTSKTKSKKETTEEENARQVFFTKISQNIIKKFKEEGWGRQKFVGLTELFWSWPFRSKLDVLSSSCTIREI